MPDALDMTGEIAGAIDGAALRGSTVALAYVRADLSPSVSFRGSLQVHGPTELALWARKRDSGLAAAIAQRPRVSLVYYGGPEGPGPVFLSIEGRARVAPELSDEVWENMIDGERQQDPDRHGVAILIEVDTLAGAGAGGFFQQSREA
jgi:pyridoxamine 5'-phosphate oxidase-like protein